MEPVDRLPPELWSEIFIENQSLCVAGIRRHHPPLLFGQICSRWRHISYHLTSQLWTELDVTLSHCIGDNIVFIQEWLTRAGRLPLSITIKFNPMYHSTTNELHNSRQLANVLTPFLTSTATLCLQLPCQYFMALGISIPAGGMPLLEYLDLDMGDGFLAPFHHGVSGRGLFTITLEGCHNLRSLKLESDGKSIIGHELITGIPWSQLVKLWLWDEYIEGALARAIFHDSSNLVDCRLQISCTPDVIPNSPLTSIAVTHPNLRSLAIIFSEAVVCEVTPLLQITSPALEELVLHYDRDARFCENPTNALLAWQDRSSFTLTKLDLAYMRLPPFQLVVIFDSLPTLTSLTIQFGDMLNREIISALICRVDLPHRLPNLTEFAVYEEDMNARDDLVLDMIESRWTFVMEGDESKPKVSRLEEVTIFVEPDWDLVHENSPLREHPSALTFQRGKALLDAGLQLDYPRLSESYWVRDTPIEEGN